jgi:hypothetical protein
MFPQNLSDHEFTTSDIPNKMFIVVARTEDRPNFNTDHVDENLQTEKDRKDQDMIHINLKQLEQHDEGKLRYKNDILRVNYPSPTYSR